MDDFVWKIGWEDLVFSERDQIGSGSFCTVYRGTCRGKEVAIRVLKKCLSKEDVLSFEREVQLISSFPHPNICLFMGAGSLRGSHFVVQELMELGDVRSVLLGPTPLSLCRRMRMAKDAALGINWLHCSDPMVIHRDLNTSNLLVDGTWTVKVSDFGFSQIKKRGEVLRDEETTRGTPYWMAPELLAFRPFDEKVDVYAFGIILWEFLTRELPFQHITTLDELCTTICDRHERPPLPLDKNVSNNISTLGSDDIIAKYDTSSLCDLITSCWHPKASSRPSFSTIITCLDDIIVDVSISDPLGNRFWKENFASRGSVPWKDFAWALDNFLEFPSDTDLTEEHQKRINLNLKCLFILLVPEGSLQKTVKIEQFGMILQCFGPMNAPSTVPPYITFLDTIRETMFMPCFHGHLDQRSAELKLEDKFDGTFLIRFSSLPGCFTLSQKKSATIMEHTRIRHVGGGQGCLLENQVYPTLQALVADKGLALPCPGSACYSQLTAPRRTSFSSRGGCYTSTSSSIEQLL